MNLLICSNYTTIFLQTDFLRQGEGQLQDWNKDFEFKQKKKKEKKMKMTKQ